MKKFNRSISLDKLEDLLLRGQEIGCFDFSFPVLIDFEKIPLFYKSQLRFIQCHFEFGVTILNLKKAEEFFDLKFIGCDFGKHDLNIIYSEITNIEIQNCKASSLSISENTCFRISIENTECSEYCGIVRTECERFNLTHQEHKLFKLLVLDSSNLKYAHIYATHKIERVWIPHVEKAFLTGQFGTLDLEGSFKHLEIRGTIVSSTNSVVRANIGKFFIKHFNLEGAVFFHYAHIENLMFESLDASTANLKFQEVSIGSMKMLHCSIPSMTWNQLELKNPPDLSGTDLSALKMSNVKWGRGYPLANSLLQSKIPPFYFLVKSKSKILEIEERFGDLSELKYQRDNYRQLKMAAMANHNNIEALEFYKNEMILYWKEIRLEGGVTWYDRILVFVNRVSSNFGQNWFLPLLWMFAFALIFYSSILSWRYLDNDWSGGEEFGQFWVLINPVHTTPEYINTGAGLFTEFVMRVMIGYFLYHFIKASRKFGKVSA